eukprot:TRINITY_DN3501_c1_g2_i1.p1 TRINITY_DN3501_c1_g2~~TRINITY_DN3501_c1_g2_i1.p1  ORF type:complete len:496 (+),score=55.15 TRINITY_DN3501_c1_g2_i1:171-1658(+)
MPNSTFALQPSIGTWLQFRLSPTQGPEFANNLDPCLVKLNDEVQDLRVPFAKKPSVGTWLQWQVDDAADTDDVGASCMDHRGTTAVLESAALVDEATVKLIATQAPPWEADFDFEADFVGASPSSLTSGSPILAPPPKPSGSLCVGTFTPFAEVVCINDFTPAKIIAESEISRPPKPASQREDSSCTGAIYHDDEESLLDGGDFSKDQSVLGVIHSRVLNDVDSASESEDGRGVTQAAFARPVNARVARGTVGSVSPSSRPTSTDIVLPESVPADRLATTFVAEKSVVQSTDEVAKKVNGDTESDQGASRNVPSCKRPSDELDSLQKSAVAQPVLDSPPTPQRLAFRTAQGVCRFQIRVPRPHPGVQYRKSKCLTDRHERYAETGATVVGHVEDDGEWLRITDSLFLPIRLNGIQLLHPLPREMEERRSWAPRSPTSNENSWWTWTWCSGCQGDFTSGDIDVSGDVPGSHIGISADSPATSSRGVPRPEDLVSDL